MTPLIGTKLVSKNVTKCNGNMYKIYKDISYLKSRNSKSFFENIDPILCSFISSAAGYDLKEITDSQFLFRFSIATEAIHHLKNQNMILPNSFLVNLIETFTSCSKTVTASNGQILPAASDHIYRN